MKIEKLERIDIVSMTTVEINELMVSYRVSWNTSIDCMRIMHNCDMIKSIHGNVGILETTRMEAAMRGRMILGIMR